MTDEYEDGLRDGEIKALREIVAMHHTEIKEIKDSVKLLERVFYGAAGVAFFFNIFMPEIKIWLAG